MTSANAASLAALHDHVDATLDASLGRLQDLLRIKSISTDPAYKDETRRAATWCADLLSSIGFDASVRDTPGHPMVVGHAGPEDGLHILYYGHYDVQPPDPLDQWDSPPFEPTIVKGPHGPRIVARGAVDDKGQLMTFIEAFGVWHALRESFPVRITVLLEGEEESGSPSLDPFLKSHADELAADVCVVCDTGMWDIDTPAVTYMLRGLLYVEITLHGPSHDLHSGMYGGAVVNPINALTHLLASLHDTDGRVLIPGFYDDVREVGETERAAWQKLGFDETAFLATAGYETGYGEPGRSTLERTWSRPTCDVNGIWGGYTGKGAKTVIGASASAKVSCRLVADQDPKRILASLREYLESQLPPGTRLDFHDHGANPAIRVPTDSPFLKAAESGLSLAYGRDPVRIGTGGSIPLVGSIREVLGIDSLLVGFGLDDDRVHSPNEKFEVRCFEMGIKSHLAILDAFAEMNVEATRRAPRA